MSIGEGFMRYALVKRKTQIVLAAIAFLLITLSFSFPLTYAADSSCVQCHTSEKILKSLHKPPKVAVETGEG